MECPSDNNSIINLDLNRDLRPEIIRIGRKIAFLIPQLPSNLKYEGVVCYWNVKNT